MKIDVLMTDKVFCRFTIFDIFRRRKMWRSPMTFAGILCPCAIVCYIMNHVEGAVMLGNCLMIIGLGMPLVYFTTFFFSLRKQILERGLKRPQIVYSLELTAAPNGIHISNEKEQADYEWKMVHHVYRDLIATYLYMTPARAFILPHTCLGDETPEALWNLICQKVPEEKRTVL